MAVGGICDLGVPPANQNVVENMSKAF